MIPRPPTSTLLPYTTLFRSSAFNNLAGSTFDAQSDATIVNSNGNPGSTFSNAGTFKKSAGGSTNDLTATLTSTNKVVLRLLPAPLNLYVRCAHAVLTDVRS